MARTKEFDKQTVLNDAMKLFLTKGFNGASMQEVVDSTGLSRSSIYDTFTDKHGLYMEALRQYRAEATETMISLITESTNIKETLQGIFRYVIEVSLSNTPYRSCMMVNAAVELATLDKEIQDVVLANKQDVEQALAQKLGREQQLNNIATTNSPEALAQFFFNTLSGLRVAALTGATEQQLSNTVQVALSVL